MAHCRCHHRAESRVCVHVTTCAVTPGVGAAWYLVKQPRLVCALREVEFSSCECHVVGIVLLWRHWRHWAGGSGAGYMPHCLLSCAGVMPAVCACNACAAVYEWLCAFEGPEWPIVAATTELSLLLCACDHLCRAPEWPPHSTCRDAPF